MSKQYKAGDKVITADDLKKCIGNTIQYTFLVMFSCGGIHPNQETKEAYLKRMKWQSFYRVYQHRWTAIYHFSRSWLGMNDSYPWYVVDLGKDEVVYRSWEHE